MNRKMRAKAANQKARAAKERRPCPKAGKLIASPSEYCDSCGDKLAPVAVLLLDDAPPKEKMH